MLVRQASSHSAASSGQCVGKVVVADDENLKINANQHSLSKRRTRYHMAAASPQTSFVKWDLVLLLATWPIAQDPPRASKTGFDSENLLNYIPYSA